jgi:hypothetical protein
MNLYLRLSPDEKNWQAIAVGQKQGAGLSVLKEIF